MDTTKRKGPREKGPGDYVAAVILSLLWLAVANLHAIWRPWTHGVVTDDWTRVLWIVNAGMIVSAGGSFLLVFARTRLLSRIADLVFSVFGLLGAAVFLSVFPFDFARVAGPWLDLVVRIVLAFGVVAGAIVVVVNLIRIFIGPPRSTEAPAAA